MGKGRFDDLKDDLPWKDQGSGSPSLKCAKCGSVQLAIPGAFCSDCGRRFTIADAIGKPRAPLQLEADLRGDLGFLAFEANRQKNLAKNRNRKYKPQKGRMKLLMCSSCGWKVRAAQSTIDRALNAPCPACIRERMKTPGLLIQGD